MTTPKGFHGETTLTENLAGFLLKISIFTKYFSTLTFPLVMSFQRLIVWRMFMITGCLWAWETSVYFRTPADITHIYRSTSKAAKVLPYLLQFLSSMFIMFMSMPTSTSMCLCLCLYLRLCLCQCIYVYVYVYVYVNVSTSTSMSMSMYLCLCQCVYIYVYVYVNVSMSMFMSMSMSMSTSMSMSMYLCLCIYVYVYVYSDDWVSGPRGRKSYVIDGFHLSRMFIKL